ncbi:hypothetical protein [Streptomyces sp. NPDC052107]|uniref:hypothetical protein n=1 Tax=Streptomyces sp. NPDC052107 TaxID=3155632 RepID=UPI00343A1D14
MGREQQLAEAEAGELSLADARAVLRGYADGHRGRLVDTAHAVVHRALPPDAFLGTETGAETET